MGHSLREISGFVFCSVCGYYSKDRAKGLLGSCPRGVGTRGTFLARLLAGTHPQTNQPLAASTSRPVFPDDSVARVGARPRINGKQPSGAAEGFSFLASSPSLGDLDQTLSDCSFAVDLSEGGETPSLSQALETSLLG